MKLRLIAAILIAGLYTSLAMAEPSGVGLGLTMGDWDL
jgi:hypothetical protein